MKKCAYFYNARILNKDNDKDHEVYVKELHRGLPHSLEVDKHTMLNFLNIRMIPKSISKFQWNPSSSRSNFSFQKENFTTSGHQEGIPQSKKKCHFQGLSFKKRTPGGIEMSQERNSFLLLK